MYNTNNIRTLKKVVKQMKQGEKLYINSINITANAIEQLRQYIKENVLLPDKSEAEQIYSDIQAVMSGKTILPQMTYIKQPIYSDEDLESDDYTEPINYELEG